MFIIILLVVWLAILPVVYELINRSVYGKPIPEEQLSAFLTLHLNEYGRVENSKTMLMGKSFESLLLPYISKSGSCLMRKWYIGGYGTIPRWSIWSKIIDDYFDTLPVPEPKKSLSEL